MTQTSSPDNSVATSSQLDRLVMLLSGKVVAGEQIDLDALTADWPEHREQLEMLLPTLEAMANLDHSIAPNQAKQLHKESALPIGMAPGVLGDFRILREVGRGGMGVVYEANQISLGRRVALKVLPLAATLSKQQLQRFKNEARAAASLKHPHIVGVYSVGVERGVHYYAMELVDGISLAQAIEDMRKVEEGRRNDQPEIEIAPSPQSEIDTSPIAALSTERIANPHEYYRRAARLVAQAAVALDYAHSQGVVHRDIKPANLLVDGQPHLWITDFGLARLESDVGVTLTGDLLGTLRYMSPEQAAGKPEMIDYRTDIHALGATLYELLALQPAFNSADRAELIRLIAEHEPPPLHKVIPGVPVDLETIVGKAMEKEPAHRYQKAGELAADLQRFVEHRPITARRPTLAQRAAKWSRRHRRLMWAGLSLLLIATACLAVGSIVILRAQRETVAALGESEMERTRAEHNLQLAIEALDQLYTSFMGLELQDQPGQTSMREEFLKQVVEFYHRFAEQNRQRAGDWPEVGRAYLLVGEVNKQLSRIEPA